MKQIIWKKHIGKKMSRWDNNINKGINRKGRYIVLALILLGVWQVGEFAMMGALALFETLGR